MKRHAILAGLAALLACGALAWWHWGAPVFVAGLGGILC